MAAWAMAPSSTDSIACGVVLHAGSFADELLVARNSPPLRLPPVEMCAWS
jgi:hypothetical protein